MRTTQSKILEIPREKLNTVRKKNLREKISQNLGIPREVVLYLEILENAVPFATGSWRNSNGTFWLNWKRPLIPSAYWAYNGSQKPKKKWLQDKETMQLSTLVVFYLSFFIFYFSFYLYRYTCKMKLSTGIILDQFTALFSLLRCFNHEAKSPHMILKPIWQQEFFVYLL